MQLDIIIPVYNPLPNWSSDVVRQYKILLSHLPENINPHLIMVNDGSPNDLESEARFVLENISGSTWISNKENRGKGFALRTGVEKSTGEFIMYTDYDFPYTYDSMRLMVNKIVEESAFDIVIGNRNNSYYENISSRRLRISKYLRQLNRMLINLPTDDTQCGLKIFRSNLKPIFLSTTTDRYLIDVEFLKKVVKNNSKVGIQIVELRSGVKLSKISNLKLIKELMSYLRIVVSR